MSWAVATVSNTLVAMAPDEVAESLLEVLSDIVASLYEADSSESTEDVETLSVEVEAASLDEGSSPVRAISVSV